MKHQWKPKDNTPLQGCYTCQRCQQTICTGKLGKAYLPRDGCHRPPTALQRLASWRNYTLHFMVKPIFIPHINLNNQTYWPSPETHDQLTKVNEEIAKLRKLIDQDWQRIRATIKEPKE